MTPNETPWRGRSIKGLRPTTTSNNYAANQKCLKKMSLIEVECGITPDEYAEFHRLQRERVLARYGVAPPTNVIGSVSSCAPSTLPARSRSRKDLS